MRKPRSTKGARGSAIGVIIQLDRADVNSVDFTSMGVFEHKYICKAPGCTLPPTTYGGVTLHQNRSRKEHRGYGIGVVRSGQPVQAESELVENEPVIEEEEEEVEETSPVLAERLAVSPAQDIKVGSPAVPRRPASPGPIRILTPVPEPTYISVRLKLPASMYSWFDWYKSHGYEGDFSDLVAEIFFQYHVVASREYCVGCGAAVDQCPHCGQLLPGVEMAVVTAT